MSDALPRVVIVGGGPAGAAAAITLARAGAAPLLFEREAAPADHLCGGFVSWDTVARLRQLGVEVSALGAHPVTTLELFAGRRSARVALPASAAGLSRRAFDAALLARAVDLGASVERGVAVRSIETDWVQLEDGRAIAADHVILASGKYDLRGWARPRFGQDTALGLRWRLRPGDRLQSRLTGRIELFLFRGGYAGLVRHEDGAANLCLAARRSRLAEASGRPELLLEQIAADCAALAQRLACAGPLDKAQAIANVPYGWRAQSAEPGVWRVGDQAAVIPSLAGEGIGIALASGTAAAEAVLRGEASSKYQRRMNRRLTIPFALAGGVWRLAEHPLGAAASVATLRIAPGLADWTARRTRVDR
ncbi:MAG: FAD-dependent monooxygenase [Novosphingobium sp.]|nr:FAD-dependent monooxygenase [Novosphingobium sp.]